jgi:hypothetical protein
MEYTFSFYHSTTDKRIEYPKWWQFWKKAKLVEFNTWERKVAVLEMDNYEFLNTLQVMELLQALFRDISGTQLEYTTLTTEYINTDGAIIEQSKTNFLKNSVNYETHKKPNRRN